MNWWRKVADGHERLKKKIHSTRIPLSPSGQKAMGVVYFSIPVIAGYFIMQYTMKKAELNCELKEEEIKKAVSSTTHKGTAIQNQALKEMLNKARNDKI